jgi:RNA polymerase sigma factor (TIGR02999 family)
MSSLCATYAPPAKPASTYAFSVTKIISEANADVPQAINRLFDALYQDLRRVARARLGVNGQCLDATPTSIVHETYQRLVGLDQLRVSDRQEFFRYASTVMRTVIVDMARARLTDRRGGGDADVPLDTMILDTHHTPLDASIVCMHDALQELAAVEPRLAQVVEMRYFGGLENLEIANILNVAERTVARDWIKARAMLAAIVSQS